MHLNLHSYAFTFLFSAVHTNEDISSSIEKSFPINRSFELISVHLIFTHAMQVNCFGVYNFIAAVECHRSTTTTENLKINSEN